MAITLARYMVTVHPDFTVFRREVAAEAARLSRTGFNVRPNLDLTAFRAQFRVFEAVYLRDRTFSVTPHFSPGSIITTINNTFNQIDRSSERAGRQSGSSFGGGFSSRWKVIALGIAAALPLLQPLIGVLGSIVQAAGAVGAALPLAIGVLGVGVAALTLSFHNLGKAIKGAFSGTPTKAEREAYDKLSASAKTFVQILLDTRTKLKGFQTEIQEQFFKPFLVGFRQLVASPAIAQLRLALGQVASDAGKAGSAIAAAFADSSKSGQLATILGGIRGTLSQLFSLAGSLTKMFLTLAQAAQPFVDILVGQLVVGLTNLTGLVEKSAGNGALGKFFNDGATAVLQLMRLIGNVGSILDSIFDGITGGSDTALASLSKVTGQFATFLESAQGQEILGLLADKLSLIGDIFRELIQPLIPFAILLVKTLTGPLAEGIQTILPALSNLIGALVTGLTPVVKALSPIFDRLVVVVTDFIVLAVRELQSHIEKAMPTLLLLAQRLGPQLIPLVESLGEALLALIPLIPAMSEFLLALIPLLVDLIPIFTFLIKVVTEQGKTFGTLIGWIVQVIEWFAKLGPPVLAWGALIGIVVRGVVAAWDATVSWFRTKIAPSFMQALSDIGGFFAALGRGIASVVSGIRAVWDAGWAFLRDQVFAPLINFVTQTLPTQFRRGVDLIGFWWNALRELARQPVAFVVNQVINPLIRGYNAVASNFGGKTVGEIRGFAEGGHFDGRLPGPPSTVDNMVARGPGGKPIGLASGEFVVNARQTAKHLPLLASINSGMEGFAPGGLVGGILDFITNPLQAARDAFGGPLARLSALAGTPFGQMIAGMPRRIFDLLAETVKSLFSFGGGGGAGPGFPPWPVSPGASRGDSGVWKSIVALIRSTGPVSGTFGNAYRHGDPLWHGSGRAVDWMGFNQDRLAGFFMAMRPRVLELIHTTNAGGYYITRGQRRASMGRQDALHRNHIHIAMAEGGLLGRVMDSGGFMSPGWNPPTYNGTGRPEAVLPDGMKVGLTEESVERLGRAIARALSGGVSSARQIGRAYT